MGFGSIGVIGLDGLIWEADNERPGPASPEDTPWGYRRMRISLYVPVYVICAKLLGGPFTSLW